MAWDDVKTSGETDNKIKYTVFKNGITQGRIVDEEPYSVWTHWIPTANGGKGGSADCIGRDVCPACKKIAEDKKNGTKSKITTRRQHRINWINRETGDVEILEQGNSVFSGLLTLLEQMGDLRNYDVKIIKKGETFNTTEYQVIPVFPPTELTEDEKNLTRYTVEQMDNSLTPEQIEMLIQGARYKDLYENDNEDSGESDNSDAPQADEGNSEMPDVDFTNNN